jgi:hypothetical protein
MKILQEKRSLNTCNIEQEDSTNPDHPLNFQIHIALLDPLNDDDDDDDDVYLNKLQTKGVQKSIL